MAEDVAGFASALREVPELWQALTNPDIDAARRKATAVALLEDAHPMVRNFVQVLVDRNRIEDLPAIAEAFARRVEQAEGRLSVTVTSAVPLSDDLRRSLVERLGSETGLRVDLDERVDPDIVGGLVIDAAGSVVDASLRRSLADMRRSLAGAPVDSATAASS